MPHIHLEYSDNLTALNPKPILKAINQKLLDGHFVQAAEDLKSRSVKQSDYVIGLEDQTEAYLHAKVSILSGRDEQTQIAISETVLNAIKDNFVQPPALNVQICVEIIEMPKYSYSKVNLPAKN